MNNAANTISLNDLTASLKSKLEDEVPRRALVHVAGLMTGKKMGKAFASKVAKDLGEAWDCKYSTECGDALLDVVEKSTGKEHSFCLGSLTTIDETYTEKQFVGPLERMERRNDELRDLLKDEKKLRAIVNAHNAKVRAEAALAAVFADLTDGGSHQNTPDRVTRALTELSK